MKLTIMIFITIFGLVACGDNGQKKNSNSNVVAKDSLKVEKLKVDTIPTIKWKKENWYVAGYQPLCDDTKGLFLDLKKLEKYGKHNPYDTIQTVIKDTILISFDFISDCCLEYSGEVLVRDNILYLGYGLATDEVIPCDCSCDYRMTYKINTQDRHWKKVIIKQGRLN